MSTETLTRNVPTKLEKICREILDPDIDNVALCQRATVESSYWDTWHWRQRIKPGGTTTLKDTRSETVLRNIDLLFDYIDYQRDVIHRFLKIVAEAGNGVKNKAALYNVLCDQAERYIQKQVDPKTLTRGQALKMGRQASSRAER